MSGANPKPLTQAQVREATRLGPEWQVIWEGRHGLPDVEQLCGGSYGPGGSIPAGARPLVTGRR